MKTNLHKAVKAENLLWNLRSMPLNPEAKESLEYAEYILAEVRHACQMAIDITECSPSEKTLSIMRRLFTNVIEHRP